MKHRCLALLLCLLILSNLALPVLAEDGSLAVLRIARTSDFSGADSYLSMSEDGEASPVFDATVTEYDLGQVNDSVGGLYFYAEPVTAGESVYLRYEDKSKNISLNGAPFKSLRFLHSGENRFTIQAGEGTAYSFLLRSVPSLTALHIRWEGGELTPAESFDSFTTEYTLTLPTEAESLTFDATARSESDSILYNGESNTTLSLADCDSVEISVTSADGICSRSYTISLQRASLQRFRILCDPADAIVRISDKNGTALKPDEEGWYSGLFAEGEYSFSVSKSGYVTRRGSVPAEGGELSVTLEKTAEPDSEVEAEWKNFRNSDSNMAITDIALPSAQEADSVALKWKRSLGEGWENAPSVQILVDNSLVVMSSTTLYKLDPETGETLLTGDMCEAPNWGYTPPSYAAGKIFCPLNGGTIQAFDAKTLKSLWIYHDPLGGQALSPITVADGYLYTGFWNGETKDANYVCLSLDDEDPNSQTEEKTALWTLKHKGGFYWAGSVIVGKAVIVGGEDGVSGGGDSTLYSLDRHTGEIISAVALPGMGDQRASIALSDGRVYFTVQDGWFCSLAVDPDTGELSDLRSSSFVGQSTSTPVIYKGRAYYGVGSGISEQGSTGAMVVADAETMEELYRIPLRGYPQGSLLLSTAREAQGELCFYATYNELPGGISMITVKTDSVSADDAVVTELFDAEGSEEYCISSLICSKDGTLYYKNDSGNIFAVGIPLSENVISLINALGGDISADSESGILAARSAYDALTDAEKAKVSNYTELENAEAAYGRIRHRLQSVEAAIASIGTVDGTEAARKRVEAARAAYDALSESEQKHIPNAAELQSAEKQQSKYENAQTVEFLIDSIGTVSNTAVCEQRIQAARSAFDALMSTEKTLVSNYEALTAAEKQLEKLKKPAAGGVTRTLSTVSPTPTPKRTEAATLRLVADGELTALASAVEQSGYSLLALYELSAADGEAVHMPVPEGVEADAELLMLHRDGDGQLRCLDCTWEGDELCCYPTENGEYALSYARRAATQELPEELEAEPENTENEKRFPVELCAVLTLSLAALLIVGKKRSL